MVRSIRARRRALASVIRGLCVAISFQEVPDRVIDAAEGLKQTYELTQSVTPESLLKVNQYTFLGTLGRGSFAEVALARDDSGAKYVR